MSGLATVGLVAIGVAMMMAWTSNDLATKQAGPAYRAIDYEVLRVELAYKVAVGGRQTEREMRVFIRYVDPFTDQTVENYSPVPTPEASSFHPGEHRKGLYAPQWPYPELSETPPDVEPERRFTRQAAIWLGIAGGLVLVFAWKTGRMLASS